MRAWLRASGKDLGNGQLLFAILLRAANSLQRLGVGRPVSGFADTDFSPSRRLLSFLVRAHALDFGASASATSR